MVLVHFHPAPQISIVKKGFEAHGERTGIARLNRFGQLHAQDRVVQLRFGLNAVHLQVADYGSQFLLFIRAITGFPVVSQVIKVVVGPRLEGILIEVEIHFIQRIR